MNTNGAVTESYDYYPFGLKMPGRIYPATSTVTKNLFTGKELDSETGWYYFGSRPLMSALGRLPSPDRFAYKYPSLSPYQYAANNPVIFVDVNGDSVWIYYSDPEGQEQRFLYTVGMKYSGENQTIASLVNTFNQIGTTGIGNQVLSTLVGSESSYNVRLGSTLDPNAAGQYVRNENASGGTLTLGESLVGDVQGVAHEIFHPYQHEQGSPGASVHSEIEAALFGAAVSLNLGSLTSGFGTPETIPGMIYEKAMSSLLSQSEFDIVYHSIALKYFYRGSSANVSGLYNSFPQRLPGQKTIINRFYPLIK